MASKSIIDLEKCIDKEVRVKFQGGREDPDDPYRLTDKTRKLGLVVCRGLQVRAPAPHPRRATPRRAAAAAADRQVASIGAYPGYAGDLAVSGVVVVSETDGGIEMTGTLTGLEASVTGGYHIHSGTTCASADDVGGHYFEGMADDPWTTNYESDSVGVSQTSLSLDDFTLDGAYPVAGRAVVIHAADGTRIGCGVLEDAVYASIGPYPGYAMMQSATLGPYPGYDGDLAVAGSVMVMQTDAGIELTGTLGGLEASATGGFHIHSGTTCASADDAGATTGGHGRRSVDDELRQRRRGRVRVLALDNFTISGAYPVAGRAVGYVVVDQKLYENSGVSSRYVDGRGCYVRVDGRLSNLEAGATGGFHAHAGTSCANVTAAGDPVGGHYYEGDYRYPAAADRQTASIGAYPGYAGDVAVTGSVVVSETDGGIQIGTTCASADAVGGHYFEGMADDPWTTNYESDSVGSSTTSLSLDDFTLNGAYPSRARWSPTPPTARGVGCGVLASAAPTVKVLGEFVDGFAGLEASASGGFHIHAGTTRRAAVGVATRAHAGAVDPWFDTKYETDADGAVSGPSRRSSTSTCPSPAAPSPSTTPPGATRCGVLEALGDAGGGDDDDDGPPWSSATILIVAVGAASLAVIGLVVAAMVRRHPRRPGARRRAPDEGHARRDGLGARGARRP
ncbi:hypothetical protein JL720_15471 [Aureococcus anophagefferens]|nr:hypothetical protein JL720_15471 [Aureococcus anophagefferens]